MKIIQGTSRHQMQFASLDDFVAANNPVRIIDVFVEKLDPIAIGWESRKIKIMVIAKMKGIKNTLKTLFFLFYLPCGSVLRYNSKKQN